MTDQYLCRGKRLDNGEWEAGFAVALRPDCHDELWYIADPMTAYLTSVDPATVGRCTGLRDKSGKLIFKDDLVRSYEGSVGRITFGAYNDDDEDYYAYGWYWVGVSGKAKGKHIGFAPAWDGHEVIGNIHDNKELLGGGEDD